MPFYTPNGLKVRLNEEKVKETILPLLESGQYTDILTSPFTAAVDDMLMITPFLFSTIIFPTVWQQR